MINYITFSSNEEFTNWQKEKERKIHTISPLMMELDLGLIEEEKTSYVSETSGKGRISTGIFVVYFVDDENTD